MRIQEVKLIDCLDLDPLITSTYGRNYNVGRAHESNNGEMLGPFEVPGESDYGMITVDEWLAQPVVDEWTWEQTPELHDLLNGLHERGLLPAGNFIVHCWW